MRVWSLLPRPYAGAGMPHHRRRFAQAAVRADGKGRHADAGAIVGNQQALTGFVRDEVAGSGAVRTHSVQQREVARLGVDRESSYTSRTLTLIIRDLIYRVQEPLVRMESKK